MLVQALFIVERVLVAMNALEVMPFFVPSPRNSCESLSGALFKHSHVFFFAAIIDHHFLVVNGDLLPINTDFSWRCGTCKSCSVHLMKNRREY